MGLIKNISTKFTHISQKWFYFTVHYTIYLHISLGRCNWLRYRGTVFIGPPCTRKYGNWTLQAEGHTMLQQSFLALFGQSVLRTWTNCYFQASNTNFDRAGFSDPAFLQIFWRSLDIRHV